MYGLYQGKTKSVYQIDLLVRQVTDKSLQIEDGGEMF